MQHLLLLIVWPSVNNVHAARFTIFAGVGPSDFSHLGLFKTAADIKFQDLGFHRMYRLDDSRSTSLCFRAGNENQVSGVDLIVIVYAEVISTHCHNAILFAQDKFSYT